jgi:arginine decarboxylase
MGTVRVVRGTGGGPTATASYDTALADAGVHNYNLVTVSSVVPEGASVEVAGTAPDLGPVGGCLTVVQARATVERGPAVAALGWVIADEGGLFYEASGTDREAVVEEIERGLERARELREWSYRDGDRSVAVARDEGAYTTAVALAVYGRADALV